MSSIPGINHRPAVRALRRAGFRIAREGKKHVVMTDGIRFLTIPRTRITCSLISVSHKGAEEQKKAYWSAERKLSCSAGEAFASQSRRRNGLI